MTRIYRQHRALATRADEAVDTGILGTGVKVTRILRCHGAAGDTAGLGSSAVFYVNGTPRYVIGRVRLDSTVKNPEMTKLTLEHELGHELGHALGLAHVDDRDQLMHTSFDGQEGLGRGDIAGLQRLHDVPCT